MSTHLTKSLSEVSKTAERETAAYRAKAAAIVQARAAGASVAAIAEAAGMSRQAIYNVLEREPDEAELTTRLAALDARWDKLIDEAARALRAGKKSRRLAEAECLRTLANHPEDECVRAVVAELDEAVAIRERLAAFQDARTGDFLLDSPGPARGVQPVSH
jgi:DNA-binding phage protein